jgi:hypothetical protein
MQKFLPLLVLFLLAGIFRAAGAWEVTSPDHAQTFTFGSERHREWIVRGHHLGVMIHFTNDPYVTQTEPRWYDDFSFDFPAIRRKGNTFYYRPPGRRASVPVAVVRSGLFGDDVRLLPSSFLVVSKVHGFLTLTLIVGGRDRRNAEE